MEVRLESKEGPRVTSPSASIDHFAKQTEFRQTQWAQRLADNPDAFAEIEQEIDQHYRQGAGHLVAALLGKVTTQPAMAEQVEQIRRQAVIPLRSPQSRPLHVRLLCGLVLFLSTGYCALGVVSGARRNRSNSKAVCIRNWQPWDSARGAVRHCNTRWRESWPSIRRSQWRVRNWHAKESV